MQGVLGEGLFYFLGGQEGVGVSPRHAGETYRARNKRVVEANPWERHGHIHGFRRALHGEGHLGEGPRG